MVGWEILNCGGPNVSALPGGKAFLMKRVTFKIRRKIILAFLFCFLSVMVFAALSFSVHREIGHRLRLVEVADDLVNNILEIRRFEKNFFLYKEPNSLDEALAYANRAENLYRTHEEEILRLIKASNTRPFLKILAQYKQTLARLRLGLMESREEPERQTLSSAGKTVREIGQQLLDMTATWAKQERSKIDRLFRQALYLFTISMLFFTGLGIVITFYIAMLFTRPMFRMQHAMEKIAQGDFTPIPEEQASSDEFAPLFRAFNTMIHELEMRQEQLLQARKMSAIGTFTSGIAHELNNPVNNIVLTAEALKDDFTELDGHEALGMIEDILVQSDRASEIIRNLLDFSRSERPEMVSVVVASMIKDTMRLVRNQLLMSGVEAEIEVPGDLPPVRGDYKSLQQVFLNLFLNAIHALPRGGTLSTKAYESEDARAVKIEVSDTGTGIEQDHLPHIFDPFFTTKEVGKGTGLGLSVTYAILQKHGGTIEVQSEKGVGTTFAVTLPIDDAGLAEERNGDGYASSRRG